MIFLRTCVKHGQLCNLICRFPKTFWGMMVWLKGNLRLGSREGNDLIIV